MKHIESIQPELAADDITRLLADDDATATAALSRLLHDWTGCDIPQTSALPESEVEELVPLCVSILRRHWTTPLTALGDGTTPMSLADLMRRLIGDRVQGNEAWSIPAIHADIPTAVSALCDRKIGGADWAQDGISFVRCLMDTPEELIDSNKDWVWNNGTLQSIYNMYPSVKRISLGCKILEGARMFYQQGGSQTVNNTTLEIVEFPEMEEVNGGFNLWLRNAELRAPKLKTIKNVGAFQGAAGPTARVLYFPNLVSVQGGNGRWWQNSNALGIRKIVLGSLYNFGVGTWMWTSQNNQVAELMHFEYGADGGAGLQCSQNLAFWLPTMCLRTDTDAEDYVDLREDMSFANNLEQFLSNFKTYIAHRLTDKGSGLTLTLSPAVRDAIQQDPEIVSIITSKGWTISPAPCV